MLDFKTTNSERIFGGVRPFSPQQGFLFWYDVWICIPADAMHDCIRGTVTFIFRNTDAAWDYSECITRGKYPNLKIFSLLSQVSARLLGIMVWGEIIRGLISMIGRLAV